MAQSSNESEVLTRRLSDDITQFKTSHHLPDDLESSKDFSSLLFCFKFSFYQ
jgi:hypothetical protein